MEVVKNARLEQFDFVSLSEDELIETDGGAIAAALLAVAAVGGGVFVGVAAGLALANWVSTW